MRNFEIGKLIAKTSAGISYSISIFSFQNSQIYFLRACAFLYLPRTSLGACGGNRPANPPMDVGACDADVRNFGDRCITRILEKNQAHRGFGDDHPCDARGGLVWLAGLVLARRRVGSS